MDYQSSLKSLIKTESPLRLTSSKKTLLQVRAKDVQLQKDLKYLAKAEEIESRSQQAKELQFRTKYEKYLTTGNFQTSLIKKDGFKRANDKNYLKLFGPSSSEVVPLHKLIYTNGEVDTEKVLCLHLLSVHFVDINSFMERRHLRLFPKRSKPNMLEASALPFYIVQVIHIVQTEAELQLQEGEDVVILVNTTLEKLITSILEVLAIVSPQKLKKFKEMSFSTKLIQEMMIKTKIDNFLAQLKDNSVILNIENYRLEIAQYYTEPSAAPNILSVSRIRVKDKSKKIELIQKEIRNSVGKYTENATTSGDSWSMFHRKFCTCRKTCSKPALANAIALLNDDGREFAVVTGAGCHMPMTSSVFHPSLTAIIKSSPRSLSHEVEESSSGYLLNQKTLLSLKGDQDRLMHSLLHKVNNSQRILIGKKAAEFKSKNKFKDKCVKNKTPINKIMENVFSKQSLISFASTTENEELKLLFQPCCKGGLGIGSFILEPDTVSNKNKVSNNLASSWLNQNEIIPQIIKQEESVMNMAMIKQDIFTSETRNKIKKFLLSENPGGRSWNPVHL